MIPALLGAAGSLTSGIFGAIGQNQTNKTNIRLQREQQAHNEKMANQANQWNLEQWERENTYNSPMQQMQRLEQAGLNPNLMYSQGNVGSASKLTAEMPSAVSPARVENSLQHFASSVVPAISMYQDLQNKQAQLSVQQKQSKLLDQEIAGKALDNITKGYTNQYKEAEMPFYQHSAEERYQKLSAERWIAKYKKLTSQKNLDILNATAPDIINKATWITRDVKQRALRGEIDNELSRELKPFGMTPSDQLWQRKLVPIIEQQLLKAITGGKSSTLFNLFKK